MSDKPETTGGRKREYVNLVAGGQSFCIEITQIREIRRWSPVTILPHSPQYVLGVINLRGAVIPIIDLAAKLGFSAIEPSERHVIIIAAIADKTVGLLVESVSEILGVEASEVKETPRAPEDTTSRAVGGIIPSKDDMIKIINLNALMPSDGPLEAVL